MSKTEKGTGGVDSRFMSGGRTKASVYVVTLRNEGSRDGKGFAATDPESALKSVAGGDFKLQDALAAGSMTTSTRTNGGASAFVYDVEGPTGLAVMLTTSTDGRLFAIFVTAPGAAWESNKALFQGIRDSFKVYNSST